MSRVVSVKSSKATMWDFRTYPYVDFIEQNAVNEMLNAGIQSLSGETNAPDAWRSVFHSYEKGQRVAIKPNFNDLHMEFAGFVTSPAVINAVLDGLVNIMNISPDDIVVYDCTRAIPGIYRKRIAFPVRFVEGFGSTYLRRLKCRANGNPLAGADVNSEIPMGCDVRDTAGKPIKCFLPMVLSQSSHLINIPILKSHQFISHSGALKNHYGTVRFSDGRTCPEYLHPPLIHQSIADVNASEQIRSKTRLVVMDALFGRISRSGGAPERWNIFGGASPNRILVAGDPVALDSASLHFVDEESETRGEPTLSHDYLHIAESKGVGSHSHRDEKGVFNRIEFREEVL